jgi:hypothetical protein
MAAAELSPTQMMSYKASAIEPGLAGRKRSWPAKLLPPLIAFFVGRAFLMFVMQCNQYSPMDLGNWARGDSGHYMAIATKGYEFYPSDGKGDYPLGTWLGNAGWMPLYPMMIRVLTWMRFDALKAGIFLAALFHWGSLYLLWNRFLTDVNPTKGFVCLLAAAFFPSQIYQHAVFPVSLLVFLSLACMDQLLGRRWWAAGLAGFAAAMAYPTGFLLGGVAILFHLLCGEVGESRGKALGRGILVALVTMMGLGTVCLIDQVSVGRWNAFFLVQAKYGHGLHNPAVTLYEQVMGMWRSTDPRKWNFLPQIVVVAAMVVTAVVWGAATWKKRPAVDRMLVIFAGLFWIFPLALGLGVVPLRPAACLMPMAALTRRLPAVVQAMLMILGLWLSWLTVPPFLTIVAL